MTKESGKTYTQVARLSCKSWNCPVCGPKRAWRLSRGIIDAAQRLELRRFLTLTLNPRSCTAEGSEKYIKDCWAKFRVSLGRLNGKAIQYILVMERQKSGYAHLHILVDRYLPQPWVQQAWKAVGGGKFVNIKMVDIHRVAPYLSKYLTKELILAAYRPGTRRYSTSRGIKLFAKAKKGAWQLLKMSVEILREGTFRDKIEEKYDQNGLMNWFRFENA